MKIKIQDMVIEKNSILQAYIQSYKDGIKPGVSVGFLARMFGLVKEEYYNTRYCVVVILKDKEIDAASIAAVGYRNIELHFKCNSKEEANKILELCC